MSASTVSHTRIEHDLLGDIEVPMSALYGAHTARAIENFRISETSIGAYPEFIRALALVKLAAVNANAELGLIDEIHAEPIRRACQELIAGAHREHFPIDVIQGGAGTSTNMNANEVIANRGLELMGYDRGQYAHLHPNEHVNLGQSTNDVYPTAIKLALQFELVGLLSAMAHLRGTFEAKAREFSDYLKMGRTQLQDAVPMTLGQEFSTYAVMLGEDESRIDEARSLLTEINLGATAIGTGITAHPRYAAAVCKQLRTLTSIDFSTASNLIEATQDAGAFVQLSGVLKRTAVKLSKVCNDLRLLSSGPRAGLAEIALPPVQAGSSIMPGKVNPVIPEVVNQVAFEVIGNDMTITMAAEGGQLQLNAFEPIIAHSLFKSIKHLRAACNTLADRCVAGITADRDRLRRSVENSIGLVAALNPVIGYTQATRIAKLALETGQSVYALVLAENLLSRDELERLLDPVTLAGVPPNASP